MSQKGLGAAHALAHQVSPVAGLSHGLANAILIPHVMRFNAEAAAPKLARVAALLGVEVHGMTEGEAASAAASAVEDLCRDLELERTLEEANCPRDAVDSMVRNAMRDMCCPTNPRRCRRGDLKGLLEGAF